MAKDADHTRRLHKIEIHGPSLSLQPLIQATTHY
jgi:hypothetical protein